MDDPRNLNVQLKKEIDEIINKYLLKTLLTSYGQLSITGSYVYDLMAWRDFDMVLKLSEFTNENIYSLIKAIGLQLNPTELKVLNNISGIKQNRPQGVWLGIYVDQWKIDLWVMDSINADKEIKQTELLTEMLKDVDKEKLVTLKYELSQNPDYHIKFSSVDLYHAFVKAKVRTSEGFYSWLESPNRSR